MCRAYSESSAENRSGATFPPEIVGAMRFLFERLKTVAEPSGACALAALLAGRVEAQGLRVGVTISGGNVAPERFAELLSE